MDPLISLIVPVYKSEDYLERCLNSLISQTYKNIEIILIYNHDALNKCPAICTDFAIKYKKLDIVQQFLETNAILILILTHIVFLWGLGIHYYLYFILVPMLTFEVLYYYFLEVVVHKIVKGDIDMPWTYPIMLNCAYHSTHHLQGDKLVLGPKPIRYLNPQYYFVRLFYKVKVEIV